MSQVEISAVESGRVLLSGDLVFGSVTQVLERGRRLLDGNRSLVMDLDGVDHSDSSALALILELLDQARLKGVELSFVNLPESLLGVARLSNIEALLVPAS